mmetsp:Transcript_9908/g.20631  ORF Transcript_9908/g.20631 Transcript_9908/m.20631 type:complete len:392 (+) Transcript_9908:30-1205(+)
MTTNLTMSSSKSNSSWFVTAAVAVVAVATAIYVERSFRRRRKGGSNSKGKKLDFKDSSQESLVNERFQACVHVMGPQLPRLPQQTQLDYYSLYKQGTLGDYTEYQSEPPPAYDLVATAKYRAWARLSGMDRMTAMQNYIDKAIHFQFTKHIVDNDDHDYDLEGEAAIDMWGLGDKPSTMADEYDTDALALEDSRYPLHAAAREGKLEELKKLIENPATISSSTFPNTLDEAGQTPLHLATDRGHIDCVKALILAGADANSVDNDGISILQAAVIGGDRDCSKLLLLLGANPDQADNDGDTPRDSAEDDSELKELFESHDNKTLSSDNFLDSDFLSALKERNIFISASPETAVATEIKEEPVIYSNEMDVKAQMKILDEGINIELDDDGDMF